MKLLISFLFVFIIGTSAQSQIYAPGYVGYVGPGIIYYPNGVYQGGVYNGFASGSGTFYWYDGSFYSGEFYSG